jgi:predicted nucleic acid-binding protein
MPYLLDTTGIIPHLARDEIAVEPVSRLTAYRVAVSIVSYLEAWEGTIDVADPVAAQRQVTALFVDIPLLPISMTVARRCAEVRAFLGKQGKSPRRRAFDLVIAARALEHDLVLVTHNARDFSGIPDLVLHDR